MKLVVKGYIAILSSQCQIRRDVLQLGSEILVNIIFAVLRPKELKPLGELYTTGLFYPKCPTTSHK